MDGICHWWWKIATRCMEGAMGNAFIHGWQGFPWMGESTDGMQHVPSAGSYHRNVISTRSHLS